jgi:WD40 repeat protein
MMEAEKKYRYPGINFFTKEDKNIFCGRDDDAQKLFSRALLNNTIVLHGDSGAGKSSLVRAGLIPLLEKQNEIRLRQGKPQYLPITIGLDAVRRGTVNKSTNTATGTEAINATTDNDILISYTLTQINTQAALRAEQLPFISSKQNNLWYTAKLFEKNNYTLLLMFDQFEELQGFGPEQVKSFTEKLAGLFASTMPEEICDEYNSNTSHIRLETMTDEERSTYSNDISFIEQPLSVRLLFALREDRLGTMSLLSDYFPDILKNDFFLQSLTEKNARQAISEPCTKPGDFASPLFTIEPEAVDAIIESLKVKQRQKGMYDPIELQIVCRRIEKKVIETGITTVSSKDLPPVENAIREFYDEKWGIIKTKYKLGDMALLQVKKHFIEKLVVNRKRNPVLEDSLVRNDTDKKIAADLVSEGLVRIIPSGNDRIYQLCHDRFVEPMLVDTIMIKSGEDAEQKAGKRRRNAVFIISGVILLSTALLFYIIYDKGKKEEENKMLNLMTTIKRAGNHTLSYVIASDWLKKNPGSDEMKKRLAAFDTTRYAYLTGIYPALDDIVLSADILGDNRLEITEKNGKVIWNMKKGELENRVPSKNNPPVKKVALLNGLFLSIFNDGDSILVKDDGGNEIGELNTSIFENSANVDISPDGRYLYAENALYSLPGLKQTALPQYKKEEKGEKPVILELTAFVFLDSEYFAAAYENGEILLCRIGMGNTAKITITDTLSNPDKIFALNDNSISKLVIDRAGKYLLVLNTQTGIDVYGKTKKENQKDEDDTKNRASLTLLTTLRGHTGTIACIDFSPDGKLMLSGSGDGTAVIWNMEKMEKITTLKMMNGAGVNFTAFSHNSRDILTATDDGIVYTWELGNPSLLYKQDKLYRYSDFNYAAWYLGNGDYKTPRPKHTTNELYTATLHSLVNLPSAIEYPDDEIYNSAVKNAFAEIKKMYHQLKSRNDFHNLITADKEALIEKYYFKALRKEDALFATGGLELKMLKAMAQVDEWNDFFADTSRQTAALKLVNDFANDSRFFEKKNNYTDQAAFISFYGDSVLKPLLLQFGQSRFLLTLKRQVDICWLRNYIFTRNEAAALKKAVEISQLPYNRVANYNLYLVAAYLGFDKFDKAVEVYKNILNTPGYLKYETRRRLDRLLKDIAAKKIAVETINRFNKEFEQEKKINADAPE